MCLVLSTDMGNLHHTHQQLHFHEHQLCGQTKTPCQYTLPNKNVFQFGFFPASVLFCPFPFVITGQCTRHPFHTCTLNVRMPTLKIEWDGKRKSHGPCVTFPLSCPVNLGELRSKMGVRWGQLLRRRNIKAAHISLWIMITICLWFWCWQTWSAEMYLCIATVTWAATSHLPHCKLWSGIVNFNASSSVVLKHCFWTGLMLYEFPTGFYFLLWSTNSLNHVHILKPLQEKVVNADIYKTTLTTFLWCFIIVHWGGGIKLY